MEVLKSMEPISAQTRWSRSGQTARDQEEHVGQQKGLPVTWVTGWLGCRSKFNKYQTRAAFHQMSQAMTK